jgi:hypothetical protein
MGATQEVGVEIVAMKGTYEEAMLRRLGDWPEQAKRDCERLQIQGHDELQPVVVQEIEGEAGSNAADGAQQGSVSSTERERRRQEAAKRGDRNAFLRELKPVHVKMY